MSERHGVVVVVQQAGRFLVIRRAAEVLAGGAWCFVGGAIDAGELQADAAVREFREEVGGQVRPVAKVWEYDRGDGLRLHWWLAELCGDGADLRPNPAEVAELRWCTPDEIERLPGILTGNVCFLRAVGRRLLEESGRAGGCRRQTGRGG